RQFPPLDRDLKTNVPHITGDFPRTSHANARLGVTMGGSNDEDSLRAQHWCLRSLVHVARFSQTAAAINTRHYAYHRSIMPYILGQQQQQHQRLLTRTSVSR
ncbi:unnamed protein product, partial [Ectocarpus sp. 8 AP-2014]